MAIVDLVPFVRRASPGVKRGPARTLAILLLFALAISGLLGCAMAEKAGAATPSADMPSYARAESAPMAPKQSAPPGGYGDMGGASRPEEIAANSGTFSTSEKPGDGKTPSAEPASDRTAILIYTGTFGLAVLVVADALRQTEMIAHDVGGFFSRRDDRSITIRVPAARFDEVVHRIERLGDVVHRNVTVEDVTEEFTDLETRLKSARAVRDRLKDLLAKATKVQDSLAIERELSRVETDIERMETRYKYLRDQALYSTITISFQAKHTDADHPNIRLPVDWLDHLGLGRLLDL